MTQQADWLPDPSDMEEPSAARIHDYLLGGGHNFAVDRQSAERSLAAYPYARDAALLNRAFLRRAVLFMIDAGIHQFLDLGSGIPTVGHVHEIAQRADPASRVVYVDYEAVAVAHTRLLLKDNPRTVMVHADVTKTDDVLNSPATRRLLDLDQPVGLLAVTIFHFLSTEQDPFGAAERYRDALAPGSALAISHLGTELIGPDTGEYTRIARNSQDAVFPRGKAEIAELFGDFDLVEPGLVSTAHWRPDLPPETGREPAGDHLYAGVARKP